MMKIFFKLALSSKIFGAAIKVALVVGSILNVINQSHALFGDEQIDLFHFLLNYFVPYCVSTYSAVKNETTRNGDE